MDLRFGRYPFWSLVVCLYTAHLAVLGADLRLLEAVERGDRATVRVLLAQKVDVNSAQPDGATALAWAAYRDDLEAAELLLQAGADPNLANVNGVTPLALACGNRSAAMVAKLVQARANPNAAQKWSGETAFMTCAR